MIAEIISDGALLRTFGGMLNASPSDPYQAYSFLRVSRALNAAISQEREWCDSRTNSVDQRVPGEIVSSLGEAASDIVNNGTNTTARDDGIDDANPGKECCFTLTVSDSHNVEVFDKTGRFCVGPWTPEGDSGRGAESARAKSNATIKVTMFPEAEWVKGQAQEVSLSSRPRLPRCR